MYITKKRRSLVGRTVGSGWDSSCQLKPNNWQDIPTKKWTTEVYGVFKKNNDTYLKETIISSFDKVKRDNSYSTIYFSVWKQLWLLSCW